MTHSERATYHHGNLREALIEAGLALARDGGTATLTLRDTTRRAGVSPSAAYRHFADRDALVTAVRDRILEAAAERMRALTPDTASGRARLRAAGLGYISFAREEPGWFETAFATIDPTPEASALPAPLAVLSAALDALVDDGELKLGDRPGAEWPCWSAVHGFARLLLRGPLRSMPFDVVTAAAERTVDTVIAGLLTPG